MCENFVRPTKWFWLKCCHCTFRSATCLLFYFFRKKNKIHSWNSCTIIMFTTLTWTYDDYKTTNVLNLEQKFHPSLLLWDVICEWIDLSWLSSWFVRWLADWLACEFLFFFSFSFSCWHKCTFGIQVLLRFMDTFACVFSLLFFLFFLHV